MLLISFLIVLLSVTVSGMPCTTDCSNMAVAGTFPDCSDCSKYHFCDGNQIVEKVCEGGLVYDMFSEACNIESDSVCGTGFVTRESECTTDCTNVMVNGVYPFCDSCYKSVVCNNGDDPIINECQDNLVFNIDTKSCTFPTNAVCAIQTPAEPSPTTPPAPPPTTPPTPAVSAVDVCTMDCSDVDGNGVFPYCGDCTKKVLCFNGASFVVPCDMGLYFDIVTRTCSLPARATCVAPIPTSVTTAPVISQVKCTVDCSNIGEQDGVQFPFCDDCSKYVLCLSGVTQVIECTSGLRYDHSKMSCVVLDEGNTCVIPVIIEDPATDPCINDCTNMPDGDYQSCHGCDMYCTCSNQITYDERMCPGGTVWDDIMKRCMHSSFTCMTA